MVKKKSRAPEREHITDGSPCWCDPKVIHVEAKITEKNIDLLFVYSIDTDFEGARGFGFPLVNSKGKSRFFVFDAGKNYSPFTMPLDEAVERNIRKEREKTAADSKLFETFRAEEEI
jgi:hypothetical protein